jgi:putative oxidoreductase
MLKKIVTMSFIPSSKDAGLLVLRICTCLSLFLKHGTEKLFTFSQMAQHFPDPIHIGTVPSLIAAMIGDGICTLLIIAGFATRWAALWSFMSIFVAWAFVHHFMFFPKPGGDHGELIVVYLAGLLAIFVAGPGRYSLDSFLKG